MNADEGKTSDNWTGTTASASVVSVIKSDAEFASEGTKTTLTVHSAADAYEKVLSFAGASLKRDSVDERVTNETREGSFTFTGSNGSSKGLIDSQTDVGGWPEYKATEEEIKAMKDTDGDGIPDSYEEMFGLDKSSASDGKAVTLDKNGRYSNLEMYLHYLAKAIVAEQK